MAMAAVPVSATEPGAQPTPTPLTISPAPRCSHNFMIVSVTCPDGSTLRLSAGEDGHGRSHLVLGRGKCGVPPSAAHVSRRACVLRLVDRGRDGWQGGGAGPHACQLSALGSQPCRVTRASADAMYVTSIDSALSGAGDLTPSCLEVRDGDVIEPYARPLDCTVTEAEATDAYFAYQIRIEEGRAEQGKGERMDGAAFAEAARKMEEAARSEGVLPEAKGEGKNAAPAATSTEVDEQMREQGGGLEMTGKIDQAEPTGFTPKKTSCVGTQTGTGEEVHGAAGAEAPTTTDVAAQTDRDHSRETNDVATQTTATAVTKEPAGTEYRNKGETTDNPKHSKEAQDIANTPAAESGEEPAKEILETCTATDSDNRSGEDPSGTILVEVAIAVAPDKPVGDEQTVVASEMIESAGSPMDGSSAQTVPKKGIPTNSHGAGNTGKNTEAPVDVAKEADSTGQAKEDNATAVDATGISKQKECIKDQPTCYSSKAMSDTEMIRSTKAPTNESAADEAPVEQSPSSSSGESSEEDLDIDDPRQEIIDILEGVESPGTFAVSGSCEGKLIMPCLEVDGLGPIGLPLSRANALALAGRCEQAPFGRGSKTIVDKTVRDTFQLNPDHFQITNPHWNAEVKSLTERVCQGLGVDSAIKVEARLYKLLLYEEGSFFAPHRDSEKEDGMFATLVVVLPSQFTGGALVVKHKGDTERIQQEASSKFSSQFAAFYADCKHELKKVTSGHRLCLVYNLVKVGGVGRPSASQNGETLKRLKTAAQAWGENYDSKIVFMTDHLYTPAGIKHGSGSTKYKGADAAVVRLVELAKEKHIDIDYDHGTVSLTESGSGEGGGYYGGGYSWEETHDRNFSLRLSTWGDVSISEGEMVPEDYFEDQEPKNESFEPTGNAGIEAERQYEDAEAIVIWPRSQRWRILTRNDPNRMCDYLIKACQKGTPDSEPREECIKKANMILPCATGSNTPTIATKLMKCVIMIGDEVLMNKFFTSYLNANPTKTPDLFLGQLQALSEKFSAKLINPLIVASINPTRFSSDPTGTANFLLKYYRLFGTADAELAEKLIGTFIGLMNTTDKIGCNLDIPIE